MSGVALDVPVVSTRPPSFLRVLCAVLLGYVIAGITLFVLALPLLAIDWLPRPFANPGPYPVDGAWSLDADLVVAAVIVLYAAWWIRRLVADAARGPVSFGVVVGAVAVTGYAPALALRPAALSGTVALVASTWIIRRYAVGTELPFSRPSWRAWLAFAVVCVLVFGSYRVYHPLTTTGSYASTALYAGKRVPVREMSVKNSNWAGMTILSIDGGFAGTSEWWSPRPRRLPFTVGARAEFSVYAVGDPCGSRDVKITYAVLGRTSSERFTFAPSCSGHTG
jgi:hypothetical protein